MMNIELNYFYLKKQTAAQMKDEFDKVHGDSGTRSDTIYFWINKFKRSRTSTKEDALLGRPAKVKSGRKNPSYA